jgi:hypothetical protein
MDESVIVGLASVGSARAAILSAQSLHSSTRSHAASAVLAAFSYYCCNPSLKFSNRTEIAKTLSLCIAFSVIAFSIKLVAAESKSQSGVPAPPQDQVKRCRA